MTQPSRDPRVLPHSPLIEAYLNDLEHALRGADPSERDEVLSNVREHITAVLELKDGPVTAKDIESVLAGLGSAAQIVGVLDYAAAPAPAAGVMRSAYRPLLEPSRWPGWVGYGVLAAGALSVPFLRFRTVWPLPAILLALLALTVGVIGSMAREGPGRRSYLVGALLGGLTLATLAAVLLGVVDDGVVLPMWTFPFL